MKRMSVGRLAIGVLATVFLTGAVAPLPVRAGAAPPSQEKPAAEQMSPTPLKVTVVISRFDGEKRIGNLPFVLTLNTNDRTSLRMGAEVPVPSTIMKDGTSQFSYQYRNVGTQIDCRAGNILPGGRVALTLTVSDTQVAIENSPDAGSMRGLPRFTTFTSNATLTLADGGTMEYTAATDKTTGEVVRVTVTMNVVK
jgi:hypothetical protein